MIQELHMKFPNAIQDPLQTDSISTRDIPANVKTVCVQKTFIKKKLRQRGFSPLITLLTRQTNAARV